MRNVCAWIGIAAIACVPLLARADGDHSAEHKKKHAEAKEEVVTVKGEVIDLVCYLDHGAHGDKHAQCAKDCISGGLPVGLKSEDGKIYLLVGDHKPANSMLADQAAKTITVRGKLAKRDGIQMLENIEIVK